MNSEGHLEGNNQSRYNFATGDLLRYFSTFSLNLSFFLICSNP